MKISRKDPPKKKKTFKKHEPVKLPKNMTSGRILSIDPAVGHLGWAIHDVDSTKKRPSIDLIDYGTVWVKTSCTRGATETLEAVEQIITHYDPDIMTIEDYSFIPGKTRGMYVVPGMIMLLKYLWYKLFNEEPIIVPAGEWKEIVVGSARADKDMIKSSLQKALTPAIVKNITDIYAKVRGKNKGDFGEQDCYDAIGQGLYICNRMITNKSEKDLNLY